MPSAASHRPLCTDDVPIGLAFTGHHQASGPVFTPVARLLLSHTFQHAVPRAGDVEVSGKATTPSLSCLKVSAFGLGCMGMSEFYDPKQQNDEESVRVIRRYLAAGGNVLDT